MKCREAFNDFFLHTKFPKLFFFSALVQFCHTLEVLQQMYTEVIHQFTET